MKTLSFKLSPLFAWLILAGALTTLFPLKLEHLEIVLILVTFLSLPWLPKKRTRSAPLLLLYVAFAILALILPLPLPISWHPLTQLLLILIIWAFFLYIPLSIFLYYLFRTALAQDTHQHTRQ